MLENLIDKNVKEYKKRAMEYMVFDLEEELLNNPLLLKMPVVINGEQVSIGYNPSTWKEWVKDSKE